VSAATTLGAAPRAATAAAIACPGGPAVTGTDPATATSTTADLDGDGARQSIALARTTGSGPRWVLATGAPGGGGGLLTATVPDADTGQALRLTGRADVDGDGDEEVVIRADEGASTEMVYVWGLHGCDWTPVTVGNGREMGGFLVGASVMHGDGATCTYGARNELRTYQSRRIDSTDRHRVTVQTYVWSDLHIQPSAAEETAEVSDAELTTRFPADFACGRPTSAREVPAPAPPTTASATKGATAVRPVTAQPRFTG
jgi:hypothetical protein